MNAAKLSDLLRQASENTGTTIPLALPSAVEFEFGRLIAAAEREVAAARLEASAGRLTAGKRTNQVDRHMADVLQTHADGIRADGAAAWKAAE